MPAVLNKPTDPWRTDAEVVRIPMSLDEYLNLPATVPGYPEWDMPKKIEWVDGVAIVIRPRPRHSVVLLELAHVLREQLSGADILLEPWLKVDSRWRVPDLVVGHDIDLDVNPVTDVPLVVAEVLSPGTWRDDLLDKSDEYLNMGIPQYWIVDPEIAEVIIRVNEGNQWRTAAKLNAETPELDVSVPPHGTVTLGRDILFRR